MSDSRSFDRVILKILTGIQAAAEVSLAPGEYTIGSGPDDDIQLIDVSLRPGHARLRVTPGKIEMAGGSGGIAIGDTLRIDAGSEWHDVEPLDVITVGMIRFVLGPPNANWTTLIEDNGAPRNPQPGGRRAHRDRPFLAASLQSLRSGRLGRLVLPVAVLIAVIVVGILYVSFAGKDRAVATIAQGDPEKLAREALDQLPFGRQVSLRREVDGTIYATGFVKDGFERRAVIAAVEKAGAQVYFRLGVLEAMRSELDGLVKSEGVPVSYTLSANGELALEGLILDDAAAQRFVDKIKGAVAGLRSVESRIRTAASLLDEVQKIARTAQIDQFVLLRLDSELIEASGILPVDKIDSWVGFLTSYSRRFSKDIALRSFVQLQSRDGSLAAAPGQPVTIGGQPGGDRVLDRASLLRGQYKIDDLFAAPSSPQPSAGTVAPPRPAASAAASARSEPAPPRDEQYVMRLTNRANDLVKSWRLNAADDPLARDFDSLARQRAAIEQQGDAGPADPDRYVPLLPTGPLQAANNACRPGARLTVENLPTAIFWLDLLSISTTYSLVSFTLEEQSFILEAALDPKLAIACLARAEGAAKVTSLYVSLYLTEAPRNPDLIRYVLRDYRPYSMDISGASVSGARYVQTRNGDKMREGGAPDNASRLTVVGELGSVIQQKGGYAAVIYAQQLNWLTQK